MQVERCPVCKMGMHLFNEQRMWCSESCGYDAPLTPRPETQREKDIKDFTDRAMSYYYTRDPDALRLLIRLIVMGAK